MIFVLIGPRGIGKSTIIETLKKEIPSLSSREGFRRISDVPTPTTYDDFIKSQKRYFDREIEELKEFNKVNHPVIITRGPQELLMYTDFYVANKHPEWSNYRNDLKNEIESLFSLFPQHIILLTASKKVVMDRIKNDKEKERKNVDFWYSFDEYVKEQITKGNNAFIVDTVKVDIKEVINEIKEFIQKEANI